jgi:hypothetical protein
MAKVIWSPCPLDDIDSIAKYISKDSVYHASLFMAYSSSMFRSEAPGQ